MGTIALVSGPKSCVGEKAGGKGAVKSIPRRFLQAALGKELNVLRATHREGLLEMLNTNNTKLNRIQKSLNARQLSPLPSPIILSFLVLARPSVPRVSGSTQT